MRWAYPRSHGEHIETSSGVIGTKGSSPLARGTLPARWPAPPARGLIPACAGSTSTFVERGSSFWAHPRLCGEHVDCLHVAAAELGSSPPVRGAHRACYPLGLVDGLIPACAGSTESAVAHLCIIWAHPRLCGEHVRCGQINHALAGSSPPVRGAHQSENTLGEGNGLIPACAGSTH